MINRKIIQPEDVHGICAITLDMVCDDDPDNTPFWTLRREGIRYLIEVTEYTHKQLCRLPSMGPAKADQIERLLAKRGLLLKGGDPTIIDRVRAEEAERSQVREEIHQAVSNGEVTSDTVLEDAVEGLIAVANSMLKDGALLMSSAAKLWARKDGTGGRSRSYYVSILKRYAMSGSRSRFAEVGRLISPVIALDEAEKAEKKGGRQKVVPKGREARVELGNEHPNVVHLHAS